jgi:hypothetical protein
MKITTKAINNGDPRSSSYIFLVKTTKFDEKSCNLLNIFNGSFNYLLNLTNGKMVRSNYFGDKVSK